MLIYHPAYDSYHCQLRILKILIHIPLRKYELDRIKIYDYYFLFINDLRNAKLPSDQHSIKNIKFQNRYNKVHDSKQAYIQLSNIQDVSFNALASYNFIDKDLFLEDIIQKIDYSIPKDLDLKLDEIESKFIEFVISYFNNLSIRDLKERTKLTEHRYELS